jgi:glycine/D-amino acid oxidase-like deaminating enzyme
MASSVESASPDVVVIGGGIVGAAAAAHLARSGRSVVLLERDVIGAGASGRNSGVVQHPLDPVLVALHLETMTRYRELDERLEGRLGLADEPSGLLYVTFDADAARRLAGRLARTHPELRPRSFPPGEAQRLEAGLAAEVAACRLDIGYPVEPMAATRAYARYAVSLGVRIREGVSATPWLSGAKVAGVVLGDGARVACGSVVVAAGPWTPALVDPGGTWRPIRPQWGVVASVRLTAPPRHVLEEAEIDIEPGASEVEPGIAFSLVTAGGASSVGSTFLDDEPDPAALVPAILERAARFVSALGRATVERHRACARPLSRDGRPLVGRVPWVEGLWVAAGHGPWGISTGPASGRMLADLVAGQVADPPAALDPGRFGMP